MVRRDVVLGPLAVAAIVVTMLTGCSDDSESADSSETTVAPDTSATTEASYSVGGDLTEWLTTEEMAEVLEQVSVDFTGSPLADEVLASSDPAGAGDLGPTFWYRSGVPAGSEGEGFNGGWEVALALEADLPPQVGAAAHPGLLPEGVRATGASFGGVTWFSTRRADEVLMVWVNPPDRGFVGDLSTEEDEARWQEVYYRVASRALREMGWAE